MTDQNSHSPGWSW